MACIKFESDGTEVKEIIPWMWHFPILIANQVSISFLFYFIFIPLWFGKGCWQMNQPSVCNYVLIYVVLVDGWYWWMHSVWLNRILFSCVSLIIMVVFSFFTNVWLLLCTGWENSRGELCVCTVGNECIICKRHVPACVQVSYCYSVRWNCLSFVLRVW